ncbi:MAG: nucleotidyl transferase AbiEii/AbiGii toxin family protein [Methylacidiphilales bacterium]|nr:nucleotidyl transferase AbiEii/AbiGii toxin family protein [Candidatus Methylacidiphilales bacterium]
MKHLLQTLVRAAQDEDIPFLVVGGNAVILLGVPRFTRDIDLLITDVHRDAWQRLMEKHGYRLFHRVDAFDQYEPLIREGGATPGVDFMLVEDAVWRKLEESSRSVELVPGLLVPVPDPLHLIAMKLQAARAPHRKRDAQDYSDVAALLKIFRMELSQPLIRDTVLKYGGEQSLARLQSML